MPSRNPHAFLHGLRERGLGGLQVASLSFLCLILLLWTGSGGGQKGSYIQRAAYRLIDVVGDKLSP